ncbi:MAG: hypothetical protein FJY17_00980 [Bacteroidetes bacterium]|nr:hypothetical protein [Bacteroidota bacterium]
MTLNQLVTQITNLGNAHKQIKSVYFGDLSDYLSRGVENIYPSLFFDLMDGIVGERSVTLNFSLYFFDRMLAENSNETEVLSDQLGVCQDIIAQLRHNNFEFNVGLTSVLTFFTEDTPDLLAGVKANVTIELLNTANRCVVPTTYVY